MLESQKNKAQKSVYLNSQVLKANYDDYFYSAQLGASKDFEFGNIIASPLFYLNYGYITQEGFSESGGVFSKRYDAINHGFLSVNSGVNLAYQMQIANSVYNFSFYAIYEKILSGKNFKNRAKFVGYEDYVFNEEIVLQDDLIATGVNSQIDFANGVFFRLGASGEFGNGRKNLGILGSIGYKF